MPTWYIATMDTVETTRPTYREAVEYCRNCADDGRKRPDIKRIHAGFYEYSGPTPSDGLLGTDFFIGTHEGMLAQGWDDERLAQLEHPHILPRVIQIANSFLSH